MFAAHGGDAPFYCVAFHPDLPRDLLDANRAVHFIRRSPDPTLQLVRASVLRAVRGESGGGSRYVDTSKLSLEEAMALASPLSLAERIAQTNFGTLQRAAGLVSGRKALDGGHALAGARDQVWIRGPAGAQVVPRMRQPVGSAGRHQEERQEPVHGCTSESRRDTRPAHSGSISLQATRRCKRSAAAGMLPLPANGSSTRSPGRDHCRTSGSSTENGL